MKWKPWVFKTVSIPAHVRCLHLKQNALQKGNLFGRVEAITPYIEGFQSSIDAKLIKSADSITQGEINLGFELFIIN